MGEENCIGVLILFTFGTLFLLGVIITPIYYLREAAAFDAAHHLCTVSEIIYSNATCQDNGIVLDCFRAQIQVRYSEEGVTYQGLVRETVSGDRTAVTTAVPLHYPVNSTRECMVYDATNITFQIAGAHKGGASEIGFAFLGLGGGVPLLFVLMGSCAMGWLVCHDRVSARCKKARTPPSSAPSAREEDPPVVSRRRAHKGRERRITPRSVESREMVAV